MKNRWRVVVAFGLMAALGGCAQNPQNKEPAQAEAEFQASVEQTPSAKTLYAMSRVLAAQHRDADCEVVLRRIVKDFPEFLPAYNDLAELDVRARRYDQALATLQAGLIRAPRNPVMRNNVGMCYLVKSDYAAALEQFAAAGGAEPDNARYRANMAVALGMLGRYDEALALYEQIMPPGEAHYNLGVLAEARHDAAVAQAHFARAQALSPAPKSPVKE